MKIVLKQRIENSFLLYLLLALACLNFLGRGSIWGLMFALFAVLIIPPKLQPDSNFLFSVLLTFTIASSSLLYFGVEEVIKALNYVLFYVVGYCGFIKAINKEKFVKRIFFAVFFGFSLLLILTYSYNLTIELEEGYRILYNVWTGDPIVVTLTGLLSSVIAGYSFYAIFIQKKLWLKAVVITAVVYVFLLNSQTATRTPFLLLAIVYAFSFLIRWLDLHAMKKIPHLLLFAAVIALLVIAYQSDWFGMKTAVLSSPIFERVEAEGFETPRGEIAKYYFENMMKYPWGGNEIYKSYGRLAHNFIQEAHDKYGIFATVALLGLTFNILKNFAKFLFLKGKRKIDYLFISMLLAIMIQICLEPVFDGYPVIVMCLLMIHGMASAYLSDRKKVKEN
jgi:hypothetical protein